MLTPHPRPSHPDVGLNLALAIIASSTTPLLLLDKDLTLVAASKSFCKTFQLNPMSVAGRSFEELGSGEWAVPQLVQLLKESASGYAEVDGYEIDLKREALGDRDRRLTINVHKLDYGTEEVRLLVEVSDVTDARIAERARMTC